MNHPEKKGTYWFLMTDCACGNYIENPQQVHFTNGCYEIECNSCQQTTQIEFQAVHNTLLSNIIIVLEKLEKALDRSAENRAADLIHLFLQIENLKNKE